MLRHMKGRRGTVVRGQFRGRRGAGERIGFRGMNEQVRLASGRRRAHARSWLYFIPLWGAAALGGTAYGAGWLDAFWPRSTAAAVSSVDGVRASFGLCHTGGGSNCVVDGDTIWLRGQKIRVADIDAPETHEPHCQAERDLGDRATRRLQQVLNGGTITLQSIDRDKDRYGRKLRIVLVDGESVGDLLVSEGLARSYAGGRRPWC